MRMRSVSLPALLIYGLIPSLFLLGCCGAAWAERLLYDSLYICVGIAIVAATIQARTVADQIKRVLLAAGVLFIEMAVVAYAVQITYDPVRLHPSPAAQPPRFQHFEQFQRHRQQQRPPAAPAAPSQVVRTAVPRP
ncbi:MAG: hypothetical protein L6R48_24210 [Planctomycetes bacterium]|nr:hypothetical protein [Planctomycetota bacterium]